MFFLIRATPSSSAEKSQLRCRKIHVIMPLLDTHFGDTLVEKAENEATVYLSTLS